MRAHMCPHVYIRTYESTAHCTQTYVSHLLTANCCAAAATASGDHVVTGVTLSVVTSVHVALDSSFPAKPSSDWFLKQNCHTCRFFSSAYIFYYSSHQLVSSGFLLCVQVFTAACSRRMCSL
eukprot:scpid92584/ scgid17095/ 